MALRDGPPVRNTCRAARAACNEQTRVMQENTSHKESHRPEQSDATACSENTTTHSDNQTPQEGSILTSLDDKPRQSGEDEVVSECDTIREEAPKLEQAFTTAPGGLSPLLSPIRLRNPLSKYEGRRCKSSTPSQGKDNTSQGSRREICSRLAPSYGVWVWIKEALNKWSAFAGDINAEAVQQRQDMRDLQTRVINSYHHTSDVQDAIRDI